MLLKVWLLFLAPVFGSVEPMYLNRLLFRVLYSLGGVPCHASFATATQAHPRLLFSGEHFRTENPGMSHGPDPRQDYTFVPLTEEHVRGFVTNLTHV